MSFFKKLFGGNKKNEQSEFVEDSKGDVAGPSGARDRFYEDLEAQQSEQTKVLLFGENQMSEEEIGVAVKTIMPKTIADLQVVSEASSSAAPSKDIAEGEPVPGESVAMDAAPTGAVNGQSANELNRLRNVDLYQVYAKINPRILRHFVSRAFIGYPACTILAQHEVIGLCCSMPAEDAIASGWTLECRSRKHEKNDEHLQAETDWLEGLMELSEDGYIDDTCIKFGTYKRIYGIGIAVPIVKLKKGHTFEEEYDPNLIELGTFRGFNVIDPGKAFWDLSMDSLFDPLSEWYQRPEFLRVVNCATGHEDLGADLRIHRTWLITSNFREVGEDLLATYMYGGQPLSQLIYERVFCADKLANEIVALAMSKRTVVKDGNLKQMVHEPKVTAHFIERWNGFRNNNAIAFKEPGEQITQLETSLADLQPLSAQQYQWVASWSGIPMTKLCKNVPSGLQATGQYEQEDYEQTVKPIRKDCRDLINRWFEMYIASEYPERNDLRVRCVLNPFITPKAQEVQQISSQRSSMVCQLLQNHAITITEGRTMLRTKAEPFSVLASRTPEILVKIEEMSDPEKQQEMQMKQQMAMQGGGMGAVGGIGGVPGGEAGAGTGASANPEFEQNKDVFQNALKEVLAKSEEQNAGKPVVGESDNGGQNEQGEQGKEEAPSSSKGQAESEEAPQGEQNDENNPEEEGQGPFSKMLEKIK